MSYKDWQKYKKISFEKIRWLIIERLHMIVEELKYR